MCSADSLSSHKDIKWFFPFVNPLARGRHAFPFINDGVALRTSRRGDGQLSGTDARPACRQIDGTATEVLQLQWPSVQRDYTCLLISTSWKAQLQICALSNQNQAAWNFVRPAPEVTCRAAAIMTQVVRTFPIFVDSWPSFVFRSLQSFTPRMY